MGIDWKQHRRVLAPAAILAAGVALTAPGALAAGKPKKPPKPPSCAAVVSKGTLERAMGQAPPPSLKASPVRHNNLSIWPDGPGGLRGANIPNTECAYDWVYPNGGRPAGDPDPDASAFDLSPSALVFVGWNVSNSEWKNIKTTEGNDPGTRTDQCSGGCGYQRQRTVSLGGGSKAFVLTWIENETDSNRTSADTWANAYELYVLTKQHNIFEICGWPMSLKGEEGLARKIMEKFPQSL